MKSAQFAHFLESGGNLAKSTETAIITIISNHQQSSAIISNHQGQRY
jgi:hypothetical protein